jgi:hypothetical protein
MPSEVTAAILGSGSLPDTVCDEGGHGYFTGNLDTEPLLYRESVSTPTGLHYYIPFSFSYKSCSF